MAIRTVRRPPRGVSKSQFASGNWYDVWFPVLAPSVQTRRRGQAATTVKDGTGLIKAYKADISASDAQHSLNLLATLPPTSQWSVSCYGEDEWHCQRSVLREWLQSRGADIK